MTKKKQSARHDPDEDFDLIIQRALSEAAGIEVSLTEYRSGLLMMRGEIDSALAACDDDLRRGLGEDAE